MSKEEFNQFSYSAEQSEFIKEIIQWQSELHRNSPIDALVYDVLENVLDCYMSYCE